MVHQTDASDSSLSAACEADAYEVRRNQFPVSCPVSGQKIWDAHLRVYLALEVSGEAACPNPGAQYRLVN